MTKGVDGTWRTGVTEGEALRAGSVTGFGQTINKEKMLQQIDSWKEHIMMPPSTTEQKRAAQIDS